MNKLAHPDSTEVFVICCTNSPESLDVAVHRRFQFVHVGMPTHLDRTELFRTYLNGNHSLTENQLDDLGKMTNSFTCADIERIVSLAASFFFQKAYTNLLKGMPVSDSEGEEITFEELVFAIENSSPSTNPWQLFDTNNFHSKHKNIIFPKNKEISSLHGKDECNLLCKLSKKISKS